MNKKIFVYIVLLLLFSILQSVLSGYIRILGVIPNLLLMYTVSNALLRGKGDGAFFGFFTGFALDIIAGKALGFNALIFMYIGLLTGIFYRSLYRESVFSAVLFGIAATCLYNLSVAIFWLLPHGQSDFWITFLKILTKEIVYNCLVAIVIHKIVTRVSIIYEGTEKFARKY